MVFALSPEYHRERWQGYLWDFIPENKQHSWRTIYIVLSYDRAMSPTAECVHLVTNDDERLPAQCLNGQYLLQEEADI